MRAVPGVELELLLGVEVLSLGLGLNRAPGNKMSTSTSIAIHSRQKRDGKGDDVKQQSAIMGMKTFFSILILHCWR